MLRGARPTAGQGTRSAGGGSRRSGNTYVRYRRHGKPERETGHGIGEVLLLLLREDLVLLVRRAAVPRHKGIHPGIFVICGRFGGWLSRIATAGLECVCWVRDSMCGERAWRGLVLKVGESLLGLRQVVGCWMRLAVLATAQGSSQCNAFRQQPCGVRASGVDPLLSWRLGISRVTLSMTSPWGESPVQVTFIITSTQTDTHTHTNPASQNTCNVLCVLISFFILP